MLTVLSTHPARTIPGPARTPALPALFVLAFLSGSALVVLGEALAGWPALAGIGRFGLATAGPLVVMGLYFGLARRTVRAGGGNTIGQVADSLYFLGFMFTLVALLSALATLAEVDTVGIVSRFGLALVTTLFGLLAKVTLTQFTIGLDQRRAHAEAALERAMMDMERALDAGTELLDRRIQSVSARIDTGATEMLEHVDRTCHEQVKRLHEAGDRLLVDLGRAIEDVGDRADAERERLDELGARADERSRALLDRTAAHLSEFVDASDRHAKTLSERLDALGGAASERSGALLDRSEARLADFVDLSDRHAQALVTAFSTALESVGDVTERQREHGRLLERGREALEARAADDGTLEVLAERTARMCEAVLQGADRLERVASDRDAALDARVLALGEVVERIARELAALRAEQQEAEQRRLDEREADRVTALTPRRREPAGHGRGEHDHADGPNPPGTTAPSGPGRPSVVGPGTGDGGAANDGGMANTDGPSSPTLPTGRWWRRSGTDR